MLIVGGRGTRGPRPRGFWTQVDFGGSCWEWSGTQFGNGYGRAGLGQVSVGAHRRAWELAHLRSVPTDRVVMHLCDNPPCVRPSHLRLGTPAENQADMVAKGRSLRGELNAQARLTPDEVRAIREAHENGLTKAALAREYGVSEALIFAIVKRTAWEWVD